MMNITTIKFSTQKTLIPKVDTLIVLDHLLFIKLSEIPRLMKQISDVSTGAKLNQYTLTGEIHNYTRGIWIEDESSTITKQQRVTRIENHLYDVKIDGYGIIFTENPFPIFYEPHHMYDKLLEGVIYDVIPGIAGPFISEELITLKWGDLTWPYKESIEKLSSMYIPEKAIQVKKENSIPASMPFYVCLNSIWCLADCKGAIIDEEILTFIVKRDHAIAIKWGSKIKPHSIPENKRKYWSDRSSITKIGLLSQGL